MAGQGGEYNIFALNATDSGEVSLLILLYAVMRFRRRLRYTSMEDLIVGTLGIN